jgi:eukaryotic-like serine/threonine-protein kinase
MNGRVISIGDRRRDGMAAVPPVSGVAPEPDIERVRQALANRFAVAKALESNSEIERYLARDMRGENVQLKVLSTRASHDVRARELFYLSARAASKLSHINILTMSNAEQVHGVDFCVVEHKQDAQPLGDLLDRNGWLEVKVAASVADQIASALDHAHQTGVLHLALQPECILIEPDGWVTVADFGIEAPLVSLCSRGYRAQYASPEQLMGKTVDHRSDLYSLGAALYEMLTDRTPYDSNDADYVRQKQESITPWPPHLISMDVPESVSNVVMKLLDRESARRFETASAFQAALDDAVNY